MIGNKLITTMTLRVCMTTTLGTLQPNSSANKVISDRPPGVLINRQLVISSLEILLRIRTNVYVNIISPIHNKIKGNKGSFISLKEEY